jgi:serine/threonine protein phosphatase PrpC
MDLTDTRAHFVSGEASVDGLEISVAGGTAVMFYEAHPMSDRRNQDCLGAFTLDDDRAVLAVADGMGGGRAGDQASRILMTCLERSLMARARSTDRVRVAILDAVEAANEQILELGLGAATTLAAVELSNRSLRSYHVGDSGVLVTGQRGRIKLRTSDHSPVGYAVEAGLLDARAALHHDERHLVSNMVGMPDMRIDVGSPTQLSPRDTIVMATDGLFDNMSDDEIVGFVRKGPLGEGLQRLVSTCRQRMTSPRPGHPSKPDDLSVILFRRRG